MNWRIVFRPWCFLFKHRRGKPVPHHANTYACPRCGRRTVYKARSTSIQPQQHPASPAAATVEHLQKERAKLR